MDRVHVRFENCHGINSINYTFDFTAKDYVIYAINGTMKTSFYKTIYEYKEGTETYDVFFPDRTTTRVIEDDAGNVINPDSLILFGDDDYNIDSIKITNLLANPILKKNYDAIYHTLNDKLENFAKKIKKNSGADINTFFSDLGIKNLHEISSEYLDEKELIEFEGIKYNKLFNEDNEKILNQKVLTDAIKKYVTTVNKIITSHQEFVKDVFELHNLKTVVKTLESSNYFVAGHILKLRTGIKPDKYTEYNQDTISKFIQELEQIIQKDTSVGAVNLALTGKVKSIELKELISQNNWLIPYLSDLKTLSHKYWKYIINADVEVKKLLESYLDEYEKSKKDLKQIVEDSNSVDNYEKWNQAVEIFTNKFINMPYKLSVDNISDIILKEDICSLKYEFIDKDGSVSDVNEEKLRFNLSKGEKKAFNILNLIFEVEFRKINNIKTLIVIDDIADSFDYKNKYAIIEYLKELNDNPLFRIIILTHNFDFYRSCANRLNLNRLTSVKGTSIELQDFYYTKNVFNSFKSQINVEKFYIASIPFVRNIIELSKDMTDVNYIKLTSTLHYKRDTSLIMSDDISNIFQTEINVTPTVVNEIFLDKLFRVADTFILGNTEVNLENKIVLSMSIRMKFEQFLFSKINNWAVMDAITSNQTYEMIKYCVDANLLSNSEIRTSEKVKIMTSENIHINAFMYEPIIDMSDDELITLYNEVKSL